LGCNTVTSVICFPLRAESISRAREYISGNSGMILDYTILMQTAEKKAADFSAA
jgi:hypothetical protein